MRGHLAGPGGDRDGGKAMLIAMLIALGVDLVVVVAVAVLLSERHPMGTMGHG